MNMCLLEVAICEKCRSSHFQSVGTGSKKSEKRGGGGAGLKTFRTEGGYFCWGVSTSLQAMKMKYENESELLMLDMY